MDAAVFRIIFFHHMVQNPAGRLRGQRRLMIALATFPSSTEFPSQKADCPDIKLPPPRPKRGVLPHPGQSFFIPVLFFHLSCLTGCLVCIRHNSRCLHPPGIQSDIPEKLLRLIRILPVFISSRIARKVKSHAPCPAGIPKGRGS